MKTWLTLSKYKNGFPTFTAYSAGSHPKGTVHPAALRQIEAARPPTGGLRSKDWGRVR